LQKRRLSASSAEDYFALLKKRAFLALLALCAADLGLSLASLSLGPAGFLPPAELLRKGGPVAEIRVMRTSAALLVGATLGASGLALQMILRNPLVDSYVLGVSSGALFGAFVAVALGAPLGFATLAAFAFALLALALSYGAARLAGMTEVSLALSGVAVSMMFSSLSSAILLTQGQKLGWGVAWFFGSLSLATRGSLLLLAFGLAPLAAVLAARMWQLRDYLLGDFHAAVRGVNVARLKGEVLLAASWCAATVAVSLGPIGFVGLVVPHVARILAGGDVGLALAYTVAIAPAVVLSGDLVARVAVMPSELPVGVVTSALGAPFFLYLLARTARRGGL